MQGIPMRARALVRVSRLIIAMLLLLAGPVSAYELFDFEQPYFLEDVGWQCKDHTIVKHDGLYHVFYIQSLPPDGHWMRTEKWFGHITSPDLRHWTQHASVMSVDVPNPAAWESEFVWAPKIIEDPNSDDWLMYYTGANYDVAQQVGLASSHNLINWYRFGGNPIYTPSSWAVWEADKWSNCRDPEIYYEPDSLKYYMFNTASAAPDSMGAISLAESSTLSSWTDLGSFFVNDSQNVMESVQLVKREDAYHLFFTEEGEDVISHISSPSLFSGWAKENRSYVEIGHACEISPDVDGTDIWSRHRALALTDGLQFFFKFGRANFDTVDGIPDIDFDDGFGDAWQEVFGTAFTYQPTWGDNPYERGEPHTGMEGNSYVATFEFFSNPNIVPPGRIQGGAPTGMIRTPNFDVSGDRMSLLVGGGDMPALTFVAMVRASDNDILFWETGTDSHSLSERLWDLSTLAGETVYLAIADLSADPSQGHIAADSIEEYLRSGDDPMTPSTPLVDGPDINQVLIDAGFDEVSAPEIPTAAESARLLAPYPNPFNPSTRIDYELDRPGRAELVVVDVQGRHVRVLMDEAMAAGPGFVRWDARDDRGELMSSGIYFAHLRVDGDSAGRRKLVLVK